jgi:hypothetical protein
MKRFLSTILPDNGICFIANKAGRGFTHHPCHTVDDMVQLALQIDTQGRDVFFACASYQQETYIGDDGKNHQRTKENAGWVKSFFLDIDCGPDKAAKGTGYATINDALVALLSFVDAVGLPKPMIVFSGGGLHVYFLLIETISKEQWIPVAEQLKALTHCSAVRLLADDARTSDIASILRPVGTHNYKPERNGAVVTQKIEGVPVDFDQFNKIVTNAHQTHCGSITRRSSVIQLGTILPPDPETPDNIARVKSALAALNPDCGRDQWRDICFAVHSTGWTCAEELARSWSRGDLI